jgi:hypothetical protein
MSQHDAIPNQIGKLRYGKLRVRCEAIDLDVNVLLAPDEGNSRQHFLWIVLRARGQSSAGSMRALASNSGPVILPRMLQGATRTWELLRMRLYLPESLRVIT